MLRHPSTSSGFLAMTVGVFYFMPQKIYLWILKSGIYLSLISVFLVFKNLLFPYITSKQIYFNVLIEILLIFWIAFIIKYKEYRPKASYITFGLIAFFAALIASCFVSVDFNLSFWGDIERMLGVFHLLHFLAFYLIIVTVFRSYSDWRWLFIISSIFAVFVSIYGLANQHFSTIGNTSYVSGYLIFNLYFVFILFFREAKANWWRWFYLLPIPFYLLEFKKADSSGGYVGLGFSIILVFFAYAILSKSKKLRYTALSVAVLLTLLTSGLLYFKESNFVKSIALLKPVTDISFEQQTFQTRLISWRAALKDFKNHPLLGTGHGNYAIIFDKYFDPKFYDYTRSETYFDRAHNNLIDIASTSGLLGLLTYLSIFIATAYYLIQGYRKDKIGLHEFVLISCVITAYFVQNLAVFDSLVTYTMCMITLAYVYWLYRGEKESEVDVLDEPLLNKELFGFTAAFIMIITIMWQYNIKVYKMLDLTIGGQIAFGQQGIDAGVESYKKALAYDTVLDRDSITSLNRMFINPSTFSNMDKVKAREIIDWNIELGKKVLNYNQKDSMNLMIQAQLYDVAAMVYNDVPDKSKQYSDLSLEYIDKSIDASSGRIPIYFEKAQIQLNRGETEAAVETMKYALNLNPKYYDSQCHLSDLYMYLKKQDEAYAYMDQCLDLGGAELLTNGSQVKSLIDHYIKTNDKSKILALSIALGRIEPKNYKNWINLAKLYAEDGKKEQAIEAVNKAVELDHSIQQYADQFINKLNQQ